jgi:hypothetical protein
MNIDQQNMRPQTLPFEEFILEESLLSFGSPALDSLDVWPYQLGTLAATLKAVLYFPACPIAGCRARFM